MRFSSVSIASLERALPETVLTSAELEQRLAPLYQRLRLQPGRLELMTGIRERRLWPVGFAPSDASATAGRRALEAARIDTDAVGLLVHAGVCRDMLEPATASFVHRKLGLGQEVQVMDISNACLGFLNAMTAAGAMIDCGAIRAALITSGENGAPLVERTISRLNDGSLDRQGIKPYFANLTIGAGAVAAVLCHRSLAPDAPRLVAATAHAETRHSDLCQGDTDGALLDMQTDSEELLEAGVSAAAAAWSRFLSERGGSGGDFDRFCCHQVGSAHRRLLFERLGLPLDRDAVTFDRLGNVGSVSCPITLQMAAESGFIQPGHRVALLGIGSGVNCLMAEVEWR